MTASPAKQTDWIPRHLATRIQESLLDTRVVLVNGPRQCGKTTLVRRLAGDRRYITLDDPAMATLAQQDPVGLVRQLDTAVIDEVQRAPKLMLALKMAVDEDTRPGRFLITGSANILSLPQIADSLAGRMEVHTLLPFSQAELLGRENDFLQRARTQHWPLTHTGWTRPAVADPASADAANATTMMEHVLAGGYPEMRRRANGARRQAWARDYIRTLMERDVRDIAQIERLGDMPRLLDLLATQCGQLFNAAGTGAPLSLDVRTLEKYLTILERLFLIQRVPAWSRHEANRLVKTPKLHFLDAGLQATLTRLTSDLLLTQRTRWGATLETWVHAELRKAIALSPEAWYLSHYRDKDQVEVDFVLEDSLRQVIGVEVKAAATVMPQDFKGLRRLQMHAGEHFVSGIVLYDGQHALPFGDRLWAVPLSAL
jgi:uncharacterized protein